jgi:hypothetical protein
MIRLSYANILTIIGFVIMLCGWMIQIGTMKEHMRWLDAQNEERKQIAEHRWQAEHGSWQP